MHGTTRTTLWPGFPETSCAQTPGSLCFLSTRAGPLVTVIITALKPEREFGQQNPGEGTAEKPTSGSFHGTEETAAHPWNTNGLFKI